MKDKKLVEIIYDILYNVALSVKYAIKDMSLFPAYNLKNVLTLSLILTGIEVVCTILGIPVLLDYRGCILCSIYLTALYLISKKE